jgi:hypothetical protein
MCHEEVVCFESSRVSLCIVVDRTKQRKHMAQKLVIVSLFRWPSEETCFPNWGQVATDFQCERAIKDDFHLKYVNVMLSEHKGVFNKILNRELPFLKFVYTGRVTCVKCYSAFMISHGGCGDVRDHLQAKKHKAPSSSTKLISFFWVLWAKEDLCVQLHKVRSYSSTLHATSSSAIMTARRHWFRLTENLLVYGKRVKLLQRTFLDHLLMNNCLRTCLKPLLLYGMAVHLSNWSH